MCQDSLRAARKLLHDGHLRSSVSRSYYAAYCAVTAEFVKRGIQFAHGWNNPAHDQLPELVLHNTTLPRNARYQINKALRRLRKAREDADYRPGTTIERPDALRLFHDAHLVAQTLGVNDE
jgi:uncharacterized protein (UPF0332 family)